MPEEIKYDNRQTVLLFIAGVAMCAAFFVFGLLIGRWSVQPPKHETFGGSSANAGSVDSNPKTIGSPATAAGQVPANSGLASSGDQTSPQGRASETSGESDRSSTDRPSPNELPAEPKAYLVRAASFPKSDDAETFAATLRNRGFSTAHTKVENGGHRAYLVVLGPYPNRADASGAATELRNNGVSNVQVISER